MITEKCFKTTLKIPDVWSIHPVLSPLLNCEQELWIWWNFSPMIRLYYTAKMKGIYRCS